MKSFMRAVVFVTACQFGIFSATSLFAQHTEYPVDPAFAAAYEEVGDGRRLVLENNYEAARVIVAPLAEAGNPVAQNLLGIILERGSGEGASMRPALDAYAQAMAQGYGKAFANAAMIYEEGGVDVPVDLTLMMQSYRDGAAVGYAPAHELWVWNLLFGEVETLDYEEGFSQAQAGVALYPDSKLLHTLLADAHYYGLGTPEDQTASLRHYKAAASLGDPYGQFSAGFQYYFAQGVEENDSAARRFFEQAADQGYVHAYGYLAEIHYYGYGITPDYDRAFAYARLGEGKDDGHAGYYIAEAYREGLGAPQDFDAARAAFIQSSEDGYVDALTSLADMAYFGEGEDEDFSKAFDLFEQAVAVDPDNQYGFYSMGYMLMRGEGVETDLGRATQMLEQAIAIGYADAVVEGILLYGSDEFAGPQSDPVRAYGFCLYADTEGYLDADTPEDGILPMCADVAAQLTDEQKAQSRDIANAL